MCCLIVFVDELNLMCVVIGSGVCCNCYLGVIVSGCVMLNMVGCSCL